MSLSTSYNVSATTFEQNVNAGDWKIIAELIIDTTGAKFLIQTRDGRQLVIKCTDYTQSTTVSLTGATFKTTTPGAADSGLVVRNIPSGTQTITGTVTANQGTAGAAAWPVKGAHSTGDADTADQLEVLSAMYNAPGAGIGVTDQKRYPLQLSNIGFLLVDNTQNIQPVNLIGTVQVSSQYLSPSIIPSVATLSLVETETLAASTSGTSRNVPTGLKYHSLLVTSPPATWDVRLEGSLDGTSWTQLAQHTNATGAGTTVFAGPSAVNYLRVRRADAIAGNATITKFSMQ